MDDNKLNEQSNLTPTILNRIVKFIVDEKIFIIIMIIIIVARLCVFSVNDVSGISMNPTLNDKDVVVTDQQIYKISKINRFDIIVFNHEIYSQKEYLIKRVIGLPGETVKIQNGVLYINDKKIKCDPSLIAINSVTKDFSSGVIPSGEYFVMGDNRNNSVDSRMIGTIKKGTIYGHVLFRLRPISDMRLL